MMYSCFLPSALLVHLLLGSLPDHALGGTFSVSGPLAKPPPPYFPLSFEPDSGSLPDAPGGTFSVSDSLAKPSPPSFPLPFKPDSDYHVEQRKLSILRRLSANNNVKPSAETVNEKRIAINDLYGVRDLGVYGQESRSIARYHPAGKSTSNLCVYSTAEHIFNYTMQNYVLSTDNYLEIKYTFEMDTMIFDSSKQGNGTGINVWRPKTEEGYFRLGDAAYLQGRSASKAMLVKAFSLSALAAPHSYTEVWNDHNPGDLKYANSSIWSPNPPSKDFVCLGQVWTFDGQVPDNDLIRCVHKDYVKGKASPTPIYKDFESADRPLSVWQVGAAGTSSLGPGTFIAKDSSSGPPLEQFFALNKKCIGGYGEYPFCNAEGESVTLTLAHAKEFDIPYGKLQPCRLEDGSEDMTIYGLENKNNTWQDYAVELFAGTNGTVFYKHYGASKRLGKPHCLGTTGFGKSKLNHDLHIRMLQEGDAFLEADAIKLEEKTLTMGKNLTESIDGDFVFLFPCQEVNELKEYKKVLQQLADEENKDGRTSNGVVNDPEYLGVAAKFDTDEAWKYPHYCGLAEEPTEDDGCEEVNECLYEGGTCLAYDSQPCSSGEQCMSGVCSDEDQLCGTKLRLFASNKGAYQVLPRPESYGVQQDGPGRFVIGEDGTKISLFGNTWKGFQVQPHSISQNSILEFDFQVEEKAEGHAICLDEDLEEDVEIKGAIRCFRLDGSENSWSEVWDVTPPGDLSHVQHYKIRLGSLIDGPKKWTPFLSWGMTVNVLGLVQDNDASPNLGKSSFSNLQFYDEKPLSFSGGNHPLTQKICDRRQWINNLYSSRHPRQVGVGTRSILRYRHTDNQYYCLKDTGNGFWYKMGWYKLGAHNAISYKRYDHLWPSMGLVHVQLPSEPSAKYSVSYYNNLWGTPFQNVWSVYTQWGMPGMWQVWRANPKDGYVPLGDVIKFPGWGQVNFPMVKGSANLIKPADYYQTIAISYARVPYPGFNSWAHYNPYEHSCLYPFGYDWNTLFAIPWLFGFWSINAWNLGSYWCSCYLYLFGEDYCAGITRANCPYQVYVGHHYGYTDRWSTDFEYAVYKPMHHDPNFVCPGVSFQSKHMGATGAHCIHKAVMKQVAAKWNHRHLSHEHWYGSWWQPLSLHWPYSGPPAIDYFGASSGNGGTISAVVGGGYSGYDYMYQWEVNLACTQEHGSWPYCGNVERQYGAETSIFVPTAALEPCGIESEDLSTYGDWDRRVPSIGYDPLGNVGAWEAQNILNGYGTGSYWAADKLPGRFGVFLFPCEPSGSAIHDNFNYYSHQRQHFDQHYGGWQWRSFITPTLGVPMTVGQSGNWGYPHPCGCGMEPGSAGSCFEIDACFYDKSVCPSHSECQADGSSCLCHEGFLSSEEGTSTVFTNIAGDVCVPTDLASEQEVNPDSFVFNIDMTKGYTMFKVDLKRVDPSLPDQAPMSVNGHDGQVITLPMWAASQKKYGYNFTRLLPGEEYQMELKPYDRNTGLEISSGTPQKTNAITHCCCHCNTGTAGDKSGRPVALSVYQEEGLVMFNFTDNSRCAEAFAFTRSEVGKEFMDNDDESLKQVFTPNYEFYAKKKCGMAPTLPGATAADFLPRSRLEVNKHYRYCVRAVAKVYAADSLHSSDETCKIHAIRWQASMAGSVTSAPEAGRLPIEDVSVSWELLNQRKTRVIASGSYVTKKPGKFSIAFDELDKDLDRDNGSPVRVRFSKTTVVGTERIEHSFLCDDGETDCTKDGTIVYLKHLTFDEPLIVYDATTVAIRGRATIMESDGCPLIGAEVCLKIMKARYSEQINGPCIKTDFQGEYILGAAIGTTIALEASYENHTIIQSPENIYDYYGGVYVDPAKRYERNDFIDIQTVGLSVEVAGGLCNKALGTSSLSVTINGCSYWESTRQQTAFQKHHRVPAHVLDIQVTDVTDEDGKPHRKIMEEFASKDAVQSIDLIQLQDENKNEEASEHEPKAVRFQYDGQLKLELVFKGGEDIGFCTLGNATGGAIAEASKTPSTPGTTSSFHVVQGGKAFTPVAKMHYVLIESESLTCDILEDDMSVRFINKVGIDNDFEDYVAELKKDKKDWMKELLLECSSDGGCIEKVEHEILNDAKSKAHAQPKIDGKDISLYAGRPNIYGDFRKDFIAEVLDKDYEIKARHHAHFVVVGDYVLGPGDSFALPTHKPIMVLRDPPGGLSQATYENVQTTIAIKSSEVEALDTFERSGGGGIQLDMDKKVIAGTPFAGMETRVFKLEMMLDKYGGDSKTSVEEQKGDTYTSTYATTWSYSTSDDPLTAGSKSDIMVIPNLNVQYHNVVNLNFDSKTCKTEDSTQVKFSLEASSTKSALSFLSLSNIEEVQLPKLKTAKGNKEQEVANAKSEGKDTKEVTALEGQLKTLDDTLKGWVQTMKDYRDTNEKAQKGHLDIKAEEWFKDWAGKEDRWRNKKEDEFKELKDLPGSHDLYNHWSALAPEGLEKRADKLTGLSYERKVPEYSIKDANRLHFSGGGGTMEVSMSDAGMHEAFKLDDTKRNDNKVDYHGLDFSLAGGVFGIGLHGHFELAWTNEKTNSNTRSEEEDYETAMSFVLGDEQSHDEFVVDVYVDPKYGTFIFNTVGGVSSAPHEEGTIKGEDLKIEMERPINPVMPDEALVFLLKVANDGRFQGIFELALDHTTNPMGLQHKLGGADFGGLHGEVVTTLTVKRGPRGYLFPPLTFGVAATWDEFETEAVSVDVWNYEDKNNTKWIRFEEPCPQVEWVGKLGREKKVVVDKSSKPVDLTIYNPRKDDGSLNTLAKERRLEHAYVWYRAQGQADWQKAQYEDLTQIDFANITNSDWKEDGYGYAAIPFDIAKRLTLIDDGVYEVMIESTCKELSGAPKEFNAISTDPISITVDRVCPEMYGKPLPIRDVVVPGEEVVMVFDEPIKCSLPYKFEMEVRLSGLEDLFDERNLKIRCEGQQLGFQFDPSKINYKLLMGREMTVNVVNVTDMQGNAVEHPIKFEMMVADLNVQEVASSFSFVIPTATCKDGSIDQVAIRDAVAQILGLKDHSRVEIGSVSCKESDTVATVTIGPSDADSLGTPQRRLRSHEASDAKIDREASAIDAFYSMMLLSNTIAESAGYRRLESIGSITDSAIAFPFSVSALQLLPGKSDIERYSLDAKPSKEEEMILAVSEGLNPVARKQQESMLRLENNIAMYQEETDNHIDALDHKMELRQDELDHKLELRQDELDHKLELRQNELDQKMESRQNDLDQKMELRQDELDHKLELRQNELDHKLDLLLAEMVANQKAADATGLERIPTKGPSGTGQAHNEEDYQSLASLLERIEILSVVLGVALFASVVAYIRARK